MPGSDNENEVVYEGGLQRRRGGFFKFDEEKGQLVITPTRQTPVRPQTPWPTQENQGTNTENKSKSENFYPRK